MNNEAKAIIDSDIFANYGGEARYREKLLELERTTPDGSECSAMDDRLNRENKARFIAAGYENSPVFMEYDATFWRYLRGQ